MTNDVLPERINSVESVVEVNNKRIHTQGCIRMAWISVSEKGRERRSVKKTQPEKSKKDVCLNTPVVSEGFASEDILVNSCYMQNDSRLSRAYEHCMLGHDSWRAVGSR